jgi:hypothetical protein
MIQPRGIVHVRTTWSATLPNSHRPNVDLARVDMAMRSRCASWSLRRSFSRGPQLGPSRFDPRQHARRRGGRAPRLHLPVLDADDDELPVARRPSALAKGSARSLERAPSSGTAIFLKLVFIAASIPLVSFDAVLSSRSTTSGSPGTWSTTVSAGVRVLGADNRPQQRLILRQRAASRWPAVELEVIDDVQPGCSSAVISRTPCRAASDGTCPRSLAVHPCIETLMSEPTTCSSCHAMLAPTSATRMNTTSCERAHNRSTWLLHASVGHGGRSAPVCTHEHCVKEYVAKPRPVLWNNDLPLADSR